MNRRELLLGGAAALGSIPLTNKLIDKHAPTLEYEATIWIVSNGGLVNAREWEKTEAQIASMESEGFTVCDRVHQCDHWSKILAFKKFRTEAEARNFECDVMIFVGGNDNGVDKIFASRMHLQALWVQTC